MKHIKTYVQLSVNRNLPGHTVTTGFAKCPIRYVLIRNKFATYYFL